MQRVVIDTNVLISAVILPQGSTRAVLTHLRRGSFIPLYHPRTLAELVNVLGRKRIANKYNVTPKDVQMIVDIFLVRGEAIEPTELFTVCRDPKDDIFLNVAVAGRADAIVSGDKDLLVLHSFEGIPILPPRLFLDQLESA